jgi:homospermidine synthase
MGTTTAKKSTILDILQEHSSDHLEESLRVLIFLLRKYWSHTLKNRILPSLDDNASQKYIYAVLEHCEKRITAKVLRTYLALYVKKIKKNTAIVQFAWEDWLLDIKKLSTVLWEKASAEIWVEYEAMKVEDTTLKVSLDGAVYKRWFASDIDKLIRTK